MPYAVAVRSENKAGVRIFKILRVFDEKDATLDKVIGDLGKVALENNVDITDLIVVYSD